MKQIYKKMTLNDCLLLIVDDFCNNTFRIHLSKQVSLISIFFFLSCCPAFVADKKPILIFVRGVIIHISGRAGERSLPWDNSSS